MLMRIASFETTFPHPLAEMASPPWLLDLLRLDAAAPIQRSEDVRAAVRDMLRQWGFKPTGRGKPASEYLVRAATEGVLSPINLAVDACNAVSLHSGLPISVVCLARARPPFRVEIAPEGTRYVFNAAGQEIDVAGLPCLCDVIGPAGNAVKDSQRTKTAGDTRRTLSVVWGCEGHEARLEAAVAWYREMLGRAGAQTEAVGLAVASR
jgi:DNA/RNA-binding domain of Phe-tRNA-synthetase-like protein